MDYKKKQPEVRGIKIDKEINFFLQKGIDHAGSMRKLAAATDVYAGSISRWMDDKASKPIECIEWTSWEKVWRYLVGHEK